MYASKQIDVIRKYACMWSPSSAYVYTLLRRLSWQAEPCNFVDPTHLAVQGI